MSTTGPMTRAIRPVVPVSTVSSAVVVIVLSQTLWVSLCQLGGVGRSVVQSFAAAWASASAFTPPTISLISWVMPAWRAWLAMRGNFLISASAFAVAGLIA